MADNREFVIMGKDEIAKDCKLIDDLWIKYAADESKEGIELNNAFHRLSIEFHGYKRK